VRDLVSGLFERARTPEGRKAVRYTLVSVISVIVGQVTFLLAFGVSHATARTSAIVATCVGAVPSYYLNRTWAWGKKGRSHLWREILPFWVIALIGLAFSTWASDAAETYVNAHHDLSHPIKTLAVAGAYFGSFAVLWVGKFVIFNKLLFVHDDDLQAALGNEVVG
jgi:putative flippase GtrA